MKGLFCTKPERSHRYEGSKDRSSLDLAFWAWRMSEKPLLYGTETERMPGTSLREALGGGQAWEA